MLSFFLASTMFLSCNYEQRYHGSRRAIGSTQAHPAIRTPPGQFLPCFSPVNEDRFNADWRVVAGRCELSVKQRGWLPCLKGKVQSRLRLITQAIPVRCSEP